MKLSIIVPCYNEEEVLPLFYAEICHTAEELPEVTWEFDFVDDGSKDGAGDYRMMRRAMSDAVLSMSEYNRFSKGIFEWVGFQNQLLPYENVSRAAGETKWSFWKLLKYSLNGITAFSTAPLMLSSVLGVVSCCVAFLTMLVVVKTLVWGDPVAGFPTLIAVMLLVGGLLMLFIGILGQYMAKTYMETKHRPLYIVRETEKGRE